LGVKRPEPVLDHSPQYSAENKERVSYISNFLGAFIANYRATFTLPFYLIISSDHQSVLIR